MPLSRTSRDVLRRVVLVTGLLACVSGGMPAFAQPDRTASSRRTPVVDAVARVMPTVVSISSEKRANSTARWPFTPDENDLPRISGMGTGVILDERGYVLTNQHVVDRVEGIEVHLADGSRYPARLLQQDVAMDLALLKVEAGRPLPAVRVGTSSDLLVGETVITIGNAFGYENTVSVGIISALERNVTLSDDQVYRNLIQTDACINPGNSGGPLVNIDGELIGINVAVRAGAQGIGFALPIDEVKQVAVAMLNTKKLMATWHGIVPADSVLTGQHEVVIGNVQGGSPADQAGLRPGDRLIRVGSLDVASTLDVERGLLDVEAGGSADVVIERGGERQILPLTVQSLPSLAGDLDDRIWRMLGLRTVPVSRDYVVSVSPKFRGGLFVQDVSPGSPADRASIKQGDILVGMNVGQRDWETIRPDNVVYILGRPELAQSQTLQFYLVRQNGFVQGLMNLAEGPMSVSRR